VVTIVPSKHVPYASITSQINSVCVPVYVLVIVLLVGTRGGSTVVIVGSVSSGPGGGAGGGGGRGPGELSWFHLALRNAMSNIRTCRR
jgi:hypothetical protein